MRLPRLRLAMTSCRLAFLCRNNCRIIETRSNCHYEHYEVMRSNHINDEIATPAARNDKFNEEIAMPTFRLSPCGELQKIICGLV